MFNIFNNPNLSENNSQNKETNFINNTKSLSMEDFETLQKARQDLLGEIQAIIEYDNHIHTTTNKFAIKTWEDIKNEELNHVGKLIGLINYLDPSQKQYVVSGFSEFNDLKNKS